MFKCFTNSVRSGRRSWLKVAVVSGLLLSMVSTPAHAGWGTELSAWDGYVGDVSTYNNYVYVKNSPWVQPTTNYLTVQWDAWKAGPYNCAVHMLLYDTNWNLAGYAEHQGTPNNETFYSHVFYVNPYEDYIVFMYITDPQTQPNWIFYNYYFQLVDGYCPWGRQV